MVLPKSPAMKLGWSMYTSVITKHGNIYNHETLRRRKLLLHRSEIDKLAWKVKEKGLTLIPTKVYLKEGRIKCEISTARGKKLHDKREAIRKRERDTEARAALQRSNARS